MLKLLFWFLLLANAALLAYQQGYLNALFPDGREPGRATKQFNADKIKLVPASAVTMPTLEEAATPIPKAFAAGKKTDRLACTEVGNFDPNEAKRFEAQLASLSLGGRLSQRNVSEPTQSTRHMVFIPSQGSKEGANKKASELQQLGIEDFYVIQEGAELKWGISLGIFKSEEAARAHLTVLNQKGVRSARLGPYAAMSTKIAFQLRELDASDKNKNDLEKIKADFKGIELRSCRA